MGTLICIVLMLGLLPTTIAAPYGEPQYEETRKLLVKANADHGAGNALAKLFREGYKRRATLLRALDDPEPDVQKMALLVITYVAHPELNQGVTMWFKSFEGTPRTYVYHRITPLDPQVASQAFSGSPEKVARRDLFASERGSYQVVVRNREAGTVLLEVIFGHTFTEGWHVVLKREGNAWRVVVKTLVWES